MTPGQSREPDAPGDAPSGGSSDRATPLLELAEQHVHEVESRIARLEGIVSSLERDQHAEAAARGRSLLETFYRTLAVTREHLRIERELAASRRRPETT